LPALQNWLVQQGVLQGPDGERAFTLTLRVPVAWAQAQSVLGQALGRSWQGAVRHCPAPGLLLPYGSSVQQLANATFGLVLAPQGLPAAQTQAMRTSAVLQLEFQPMPMAASQVAQQAVTAGLLPAGMLPQEAYQAPLARGGDPGCTWPSNRPAASCRASASSMAATANATALAASTRAAPNAPSHSVPR
jgi:hypothetical protein